MKRCDVRRVGWLVWGILLLAMTSNPSFPVDDCPDAWISTKISARLVAEMGAAAARINPDTGICCDSPDVMPLHDQGAGRSRRFQENVVEGGALDTQCP